MSVFTKAKKYVEFLGVQADEVLVRVAQKVAEATGIEADLQLLGIVAGVESGVLRAAPDIQGQYVAEQAKKGKRLPLADEDPASDSAIDPRMVAFGELPAEVQDMHTAIFNAIRAGLAAAGRL